ncbi:hypothetical protein JCM15764A_05210 [Geotalea toluenoxydans]
MLIVPSVIAISVLFIECIKVTYVIPRPPRSGNNETGQKLFSLEKTCVQKNQIMKISHIMQAPKNFAIYI